MEGKVVVRPSGGWNNWQDKSAIVKGATGVHDIYLKFSGEADELFRLNWWKFNK